MITQHELKQWLDYNPDTGIFTWKISPNSFTKIGKVCTSIDKDGYIRVCIKGKTHRAHRLAFLYMTGFLPEKEIDHINGVKTDNRFCNLRSSSRVQNEYNKGLSKRNKSGVKGVWFDKSRNNWRAFATVNGKYKYLGRFSDFDEAVKVRNNFIKENYDLDFYRERL